MPCKRDVCGVGFGVCAGFGVVGFAAAIDDGATTIAKTADALEEKVSIILEDLTAAARTAEPTRSEEG